MPIGEVLEKAFKYPWKNKTLWFYGVLIAIFTAGSVVTNQYDVGESDFTFLESINTTTLWIIGAGIVVIGLILGIVGLIITCWSKIAIFRGTAMLEEGKEITRKEIGKTGRRPVWKLIVLDYLVPVMIFFVFLLIIALFIALFYLIPQPAGLWIGVVTGIIVFFALIPFLIYFSYIWVLAARYVALEDMNVIDSLRTGQRLIKGKFWWTFLLGIVQGMISGAATFAAILPLIFLIGIAIFLAANKLWIGVVILGVFSLLYIAVYIVILGYFVAFENTGWTIWWLKLKEAQITDQKTTSQVVKDSQIKSKKKGK